MSKTIAFCAHKGGVGKTFATRNVGVGLANLGKRVLLVDLDNHSTLTRRSNIKLDPDRQLYFVLAGDCAIRDCIYPITDRVDILPTTKAMAHVSSVLPSDATRSLVLKNCLDQVSADYDYILLDCPPNVGDTLSNGLNAAQFAVISASPDPEGVDGMNDMLEMIINLRSAHDVTVLGVLLNLCQENTVAHRSYIKAIRNSLANLVFTTAIPRSIASTGASAKKLDIFRHSPRSKLAKSYLEVSKELSRRIENLSELAELATVGCSQ